MKVLKNIKGGSFHYFDDEINYISRWCGFRSFSNWECGFRFILRKK